MAAAVAAVPVSVAPVVLPAPELSNLVQSISHTVTVGVDDSEVEKADVQQGFFQQSLILRNELGAKDFEALVKAGDTHIVNSRKFIVYGAQRVSLTGRVIVLGADNVEPIEELAKIFKEVVVVNYDPNVLERLKKRVPTVITKHKDLTGGLGIKIDEILKALGTNATDAAVQASVAKICELMKAFPKMESTWTKELGQADYVVSSLMATQMCSVEIDVVSFFKHHYHVDLQKTNNQYRNVSQRLSIDGIIKHIQDVHTLTIQGGTVYFSDTMTATRFEPVVGGLNRIEIVPSEILASLPKLFSIVKSNKWHWHGKNSPKAYEVHGFLMTKPNASETANGGKNHQPSANGAAAAAAANN